MSSVTLNGRTVYDFVMNCEAASLLDYQETVAAEISFSLPCPTERIVFAKFQVHQCESSILVRGMLVLSYLYIFIYFSSL